MHTQNNNRFRYSIFGALAAAALVAAALVYLNYQLSVQTRTINANIESIAASSGSTFSFNRGVWQISELRRLIVDGGTPEEIELAFGIASARMTASQGVFDNPVATFSAEQQDEIVAILSGIVSKWDDVRFDIGEGIQDGFEPDQVAFIDQSLTSIATDLHTLAVEIDTPRAREFARLTDRNSDLLTTTQITLWSVVGLSVLLSIFLTTGTLSLRQAIQQREQALGELKQLNNELEVRVADRTAELSVAKQKAENASQAKSIFLSNMSHELRTPLNMVIGYTSSMLDLPQMYKNETLPTIYRTDIETIRESGRYLLGLINDILDLSKIEAGKLEIYPEATTLKQVFDGVIATSVGLINDKPLQIRPEYPSELPHVWADSLRIRQVLLNLMSNAVKYTKTGTVSLIAEVRGDELWVAVKDTGKGLSPEAIAVIFDRYEQVHADVEIQGTGLGLDISQKLIQMHGGTIHIDSLLNHGSTFSFSLPLAKPEQIGRSAALLDEPAYTSDVDIADLPDFDLTMNMPTILIVENDAEHRSQLRAALESNNCLVFDSAFGQEVFEMAQAICPQVVVVNIDAGVSLADVNALVTKMAEDNLTDDIPIVTLTEQRKSVLSANESEVVTTFPRDISIDELSERLVALSTVSTA